MRSSLLISLLLLSSACATAPSARAPAPWDANGAIAAPQVVLEEWRNAENRGVCAPLTFADAGERVRGGTPRRANFSGGWGVAWDVAGLPGRDPSGFPCQTCGRGVYGIAGTGVAWGTNDGSALTDRIEWAGRNHASYGLEGGTGPGWLAQVRVADQGCVYNVWSFLGREHLEHLIRNLRRVAQ